MNLVNELENDLAMAFFVERDYTAKLEAAEVVALFNRLRESLELTFPDDDPVEEAVHAAGFDAVNH